MKRKKKKSREITISSLLRKHFGKMALESLVTSRRHFPITAQVDLQRALLHILDSSYQARLVGIHVQYSHQPLSFAQLLREQYHPVLVGPLEYDEIEMGEAVPTRCLRQGLWLGESKDTRFTVLLGQAERYGTIEGLHLEIAVPPGEEGMQLCRTLLDQIETLVREGYSYRGKVISLEASDDYSGRVGRIKVHQLRSVSRDDVILPNKTLTLLERNVTGFIAQRARLSELGMGTKKGLLFYGQPGTGKTHTIHYLASQLPGHTTLLITAGQMGLLDTYFQLARFLQPAMLVIEDVDLIARQRERMRGACEESLLNRLLNEMDGLREEAAVLFVLTTNRPDQLEGALASRPGRIDQAIEFPLPDDVGRRKLTKLYSGGLEVSADVTELIVRKTNKASPAFIKELMRRCTQYMIQNGDGLTLTPEHVESSIEEMIFSGGSLNVKLLGGAVDK